MLVGRLFVPYGKKKIQMSRIGKEPILIPESVSIRIEDNIVHAQGRRGELKQSVPQEIILEIKGDYLQLTRRDERKCTRGFHGLYRVLCANIIQGVDRGFMKELCMKGVGYRAEIKNTHVVFNLGYSTQIYYNIPKDISITYDKKEKITISGIDKQRVGQVAAEIRSLRKVEPYKGKGIRYCNEEVRLKVGKAGVK